MLNKLLPIFFAIIINNDNSFDIIGKVYDLNNSEDLAGVQVRSFYDTTYTNLNGSFKINCLSDTTKLIFNYCSYESDTLYVSEIYKKFSEKN